MQNSTFLNRCGVNHWLACLLILLCCSSIHAMADIKTIPRGAPISNNVDPPTPEDLMVVDFIDNNSLDSATKLAIQTCAGLFNRNVSVAGAAYTLMKRWDAAWLNEIENISDPTPYVVDKDDFLHKCIATVAKGRYIHYNYQAQQVLVPVIITLAGVLDAVPLDLNHTFPLDGLTMVLDAEKEFSGFDAYHGTKYLYDLYANQTTTMAKLNPGYEFSKSGVDKLDPPLTGQPNLHLVDYLVKERLFTYYLVKGCIPMTEEHGLMEVMVKPRGDIPWPRPIAVFGYDEFSLGGAGDPFEAETDCVREHNLGQVATNDVNNLAFFSRKLPITEPLQQPPATRAKQVYNASKTYLALVLGDGDNFVLMKERNYDWMQQRLSYCQNQSITNNCFPLSWTVSPHSLYAAPDLLKWIYQKAQITGKDSFLLPPSGHLYAYPATMREDGAQKDFIKSTERDAFLLNTSGTVDWEFAFTWGKAIHHYFPHYAEKEDNTIRSVFAVDVPFNIPTFEFGRGEYYKIIRGSRKNDDNDKTTGAGATVLFRPREWRGTGNSGIPFSHDAYLTEKEMGDEINGYPPGTVSYIYVTSDGGGDLTMLYKMVPFLDEHVEIVNHEAVTDLALQRNSRVQNLATPGSNEVLSHSAFQHSEKLKQQTSKKSSQLFRSDGASDQLQAEQ